MGGLNSKEQTKAIFMNIERIKTFLTIKKRFKMLKALQDVENLSEDLKFRFGKINNKYDELIKKNEGIEKINDRINQTIMQRVSQVAKESMKIQEER